MRKFWGGCMAMLLSVGTVSIARPLDVDAPFRPVSEIVRSVAEQTGMPLQATSEIGDDIVFVRIRNQEPEEFLTKLADCLEATWTTETGGIRILGRTPEQMQASETQSRSILARRIRQQIQQACQQLTDTPEINESIAERMAVAELSISNLLETDGRSGLEGVVKLKQSAPLYRAMLRLLNEVNPTELAKIRVGQRLVFSSQPNVLQRTFSSGAEAALLSLQYEQRILQTKLVPDESRPYLYLPRFPSSFFDQKLTCMMEISRLDSHVFQVDFLLGDKDFADLDSCEMRLDTMPRSEKPILPGFISEDQSLMRLSEPTRVYLSSFANVMRQYVPNGVPSTEPKYLNHPSIREMTEAELEALTKPSETDPLALGFAELFQYLSDRYQKSVIAVLSDRSMRHVFFGLDTSTFFITPKTGDVFQTLMSSSDSKVDADDDWITFLPNLAFESRRGQTSRAWLQKVLNHWRKEGYVDIEDAARYLSTPSQDQCNIEPGIASLVTGGLQLGHLQRVPRIDALSTAGHRLYHLLSADQRRQAQTPEGLRASQLQGATRHAVVDFLLTPFQGSSYKRHFSKTLQDHPTRLLANGIPPNTWLEILDTQSFSLSIMTDGKVVPVTEFQIAASLAKAEGITIQGATPLEVLPNTKFRVGSSRMLLMRVMLPDLSSASTPTSSLSFLSNKDGLVRFETIFTSAPPISKARWVTYDSLPAKVREAIEERLRALRERFGPKTEFSAQSR